MECQRCGEEGSGNYCAACGAPLAARQPAPCPGCGADVEPDDRFCTACGEPVRRRPEKSLRDHAPWILSGLALVAFAVGIALLLPGQTSPRRAGQPPTGGVEAAGGRSAPEDGGPGTAAPGERSPAEGGAGEMPDAGELADMSPREAGDRLFNRVMRLRSSGDGGRAPFFARMGIRAYERVPASEVDADLRFHVGLLQIVGGDAAAAAAARWRDSLRAAAAATDTASRPEYRAHASLLREALDGG